MIKRQGVRFEFCESDALYLMCICLNVRFCFDLKGSTDVVQHPSVPSKKDTFNTAMTPSLFLLKWTLIKFIGRWMRGQESSNRYKSTKMQWVRCQYSKVHFVKFPFPKYKPPTFYFKFINFWSPPSQSLCLLFYYAIMINISSLHLGVNRQSWFLALGGGTGCGKLPKIPK